MPIQPKYPSNVQSLTTSDQDLTRVQTNIITPLNKTLAVLNASPPTFFYPMGYEAGTVAANTWTPLTIDGTHNAYYMQDVNTYLLNTMLVVNSGTGSTTVSFRLININNNQILWTSGLISRGTVVLGGAQTYGSVTMLAGQTYVMQCQQTTGSVTVQASASMKVAY